MTDYPEHDPRAALFQPKATQPATNSNSLASQHTGTYVGSRYVDGQVVSHGGSKAIGSSHAENVAEINAKAGVPYERAMHPTNRSPVPHDQVKDDTILRFANGAEVTARDARMMGWLEAPSNPFADRASRPERLAQDTLKIEQQQQEETNPDLDFDLLADEALDRDYSSLLDTTAGMEQQAAIQQVISNGEINQKTLGTLATQLQCEPEQLQARVAPIMEAFKAQALNVMGEGGLDGNDVVAWAQQHAPDKLQQAMNRQANMRQAGGYADVRLAYLEALGDDRPSIALNADLGNGITQRQDSKGRVIVNIPGYGEMAWRTAIQAFARR